MIGYKVIVVCKCIFIEKCLCTQLIYVFLNIIIILLWGSGVRG